MGVRTVFVATTRNDAFDSIFSGLYPRYLEVYCCSIGARARRLALQPTVALRLASFSA